MFDSLLNAFRAPDIRRRVLYVLALLIVFRLLAAVPVPGIDSAQLKKFLEGNPIFGLLDLFSGGGLAAFSVVALGMNPYINASIIMQLMSGVVPSLQALSREGEYGRNKITQYTRYLTVPLAILQAYGFLALLNSQGVLTGGFDLASFTTLTQIATLTAGAIALMWIGELITERGIGNGISFIIFAGIVSRAPGAVGAFIASPNIATFIAFAAVAVAAVGVIIYIQEGQRRIPIQYASRVRGRRMYSGGQTFLPLRVNQAGVIPIIFAISILLFPQQMASYFTTSEIPIVANIASAIVTIFNPNSLFHAVMLFLLTMGFTYFYTAFTFKPDETGRAAPQERWVHPGYPARPAHPGLPRSRRHADHVRRGALPRDRRRLAVAMGILVARGASDGTIGLGGSEPADRRVRRRRHHEADRGAIDDAQLRRLHPMMALSLTASLDATPDR